MPKKPYIVGQLYKLTKQMYGFIKGHVVVITWVDKKATSKNRIDITTTEPSGDEEFDTVTVGKNYEKFLERFHAK